MAEVGRNILSFKITIEGSRPRIWRRILVNSYCTFYDLHVAIQSVMGWEDLEDKHYFAVGNPIDRTMKFIGVPKDNEEWENRKLCGRIESVILYLKDTNPDADYIYGDWHITVVRENLQPAEVGENYPQCIDGKNASPPVACGNIEVYMELLEIISNRSHEEYQEKIDWLRNLNWLNGDFDPTEFDPETVVFADPEERWILSSVNHSQEMHRSCPLRSSV